MLGPFLQMDTHMQNNGSSQQPPKPMLGIQMCHSCACIVCRPKMPSYEIMYLSPYVSLRTHPQAVIYTMGYQTPVFGSE